MDILSPVEPDALQNRQESNLSFFVHDRLSLALSYNEKPHSLPPMTVKFAQISLLESYLWLYWGVVIGYFPPQLSRRVVYEHFGSILRVYEAALTTPEMKTCFTPASQIIFDAEFNGRRGLFTSFKDEEEYSERVSSLFHAVFVLANGYAESGSVSRLTQVVAFVPDDLWPVVVSGKQSPVLEQILDLKEESASGSDHWTIDGFFASLDFMESFRTIQDDVESSTDRNPRGFYDFIRSLKETQQWRLNFGYTRDRERFLQIAELAATAYIRQVSGGKIPDIPEALRMFRNNVYGLMTDWGAPIARSASNA